MNRKPGYYFVMLDGGQWSVCEFTALGWKMGSTIYSNEQFEEIDETRILTPNERYKYHFKNINQIAAELGINITELIPVGDSVSAVEWIKTKKENDEFLSRIQPCYEKIYEMLGVKSKEEAIELLNSATNEKSNRRLDENEHKED